MSVVLDIDTHSDKATPRVDGRRLMLCATCDLLVATPERGAGQRAHCPRCQHPLTGYAQRDTQALMAWAITTLTALFFVFLFPFLGFSSYGVSHQMSFQDTIVMLVDKGYIGLSVLLFLTTVLLPAFYFGSFLYLCLSIRLSRQLPGAMKLARSLRPLEPWLMGDVFVIGVLVSLIKIISMADIQIYHSFIAFCIFALASLRTLILIDWPGFWDQLAPRPNTGDTLVPGVTGYSQDIKACSSCEMPYSPSGHTHCPRCHKRHRDWGIDRMQLTWALLAAAAILYIPANLYPILYTIWLEEKQPQTIAAGIMALAQSGDWPIAGVIFIASIMVPISKVIALVWLCLIARKPPSSCLFRTRAFAVVEKIGRWSMIDVCVVAILNALVQAGQLLSIVPGPGISAFAAVVIITMIAVETFDTRLLWPQIPLGRTSHER